MLLALPKRQFVHIALHEEMPSVEVQPLPVSPRIYKELQRRVFGLISQGLAEGISGSHRQTPREPLIEFDLQPIVHRTVPDITQLGISLPAERQILRLALDVSSHRR